MIIFGKALKFSLFSKYFFNVNTYREFSSTQVWSRYDASTLGSSLQVAYLPQKTKLGLTGNRNIKVEKKFKKKEKKKSKKSGPLVISCKEKKRNHYLHTKYDKNNGVTLACNRWGKRLLNGDYFSILPFSENPAFLYPDKLEYPPNSFTLLGICEELVERLKRIGIERPTFVQYAAIPRIMAGQHILLSGEAGCGKTLAFVLPMLENILKWKTKIPREYNSPLGVIVVPTGELAMQIERVIKSLVEGMDINFKVVLSGHSKASLMNISSDDIEYVDIVICTLGVLCKLTYHEIYSLSKCLNLVFDEADMLLDDTFIKSSRQLMSRANFQFDNENSTGGFPTGARLSLVSATFPYNIHEKLGVTFPTHLLQNITTKYLHRTLPHIKHKFIRCAKLHKKERLLDLTRSYVEKNEPVVIFSNKTETCKWLVYFLKENSIECSLCISKMDHEKRIAQLKRFQNGEVIALVSTDLFSRGLNLTHVQHVINYEFPMFLADYVHRSGRTGRMGIAEELKNSCSVTSFVSSKYDVFLLKQLEASVRKNNTLPNMDYNLERYLRDRGSLLSKKTVKRGRRSGTKRTSEVIVPSEREALGSGHPSARGHRSSFSAVPELSEGISPEAGRGCLTEGLEADAESRK